jgi:hypothetical protein
MSPGEPIVRRQNMLKKEDFAVIKGLNNQGAFIKDIAAEIGVYPRTVGRAIARGSAPKPQRKRRDRKLDPYKLKIDKLLLENFWNAMVILHVWLVPHTVRLYLEFLCVLVGNYFTIFSVLIPFF